MAAVDAGRVIILPKGPYNSATNYEVLDLVRYQEQSWLCKTACIGIEPAEGTYWTLFASSSPIATETTPGLVFPDGETISIADDGSGELSVPIATDSAAGLVKADGTTLDNTDGVLSVKNVIARTAEVSEVYSATATYTAGQYVIYNNELYKCIQNTVTGILPTNTSYFTKTTVGSEISSINTHLTDILTCDTQLGTNNSTYLVTDDAFRLRFSRCGKIVVVSGRIKAKSAFNNTVNGILTMPFAPVSQTDNVSIGHASNGASLSAWLNTNKRMDVLPTANIPIDTQIFVNFTYVCA